MTVTRSKSSSRRKKNKTLTADRPQFNAKYVMGNKGSRMRDSFTIVPHNLYNCKPFKVVRFKGSNASLDTSIGFGVCIGSPASNYNC